MNNENVGNEECVTVYTCRGKNRIIAEGGSQAWRIDMSKASKHRYLICVQNRNQTWGQATADHQTAFLIAKISTVEKSPVEKDADRAIIRFSEFADLAVPNSWDGNRNPVAYRTLSEFGINSSDDLENLNWTRLGSHFNLWEETPTLILGDDYEAAKLDDTSSPELTTQDSLSIDDAKRGLALRFGVSVEQIEIIIRG
ncbi:hypothetical protein ACKJSM_12430 [Pseudomonas sp. PHC1]|uniref:hypothetical protein n=1 Tax=Pseudomonas sp. PHC1 TaxID=3384759 RepID=UPI00396F738F